MDHILSNKLDQLIGNATTASRQELFAQLLDPRRDVDADCGYPSSDQGLGIGSISMNIYKTLYEREAIATRVVQVFPKECWQITPRVFEDETPGSITEFEIAWDELGRGLQGEASWHRDDSGSPVWDYMKRVDILSRIGHFGVLLLGIDDAKNLDQPVEGVSTTDPAGSGFSFGGVQGSLQAGNPSDLYSQISSADTTSGYASGSGAPSGYAFGGAMDEVKGAPKPGVRGGWPGNNQAGRRIFAANMASLQRRQQIFAVNMSQRPTVNVQANWKVKGKTYSKRTTYQAAYYDVAGNAWSIPVPAAGMEEADFREEEAAINAAVQEQRQKPERPPVDYGTRGNLPPQDSSGYPKPGETPSTIQLRSGSDLPPGLSGVQAGSSDEPTKDDPLGLASGAVGTDAQYVGIQLGPSEYPAKLPAGERHRLLFLRPFDESLIQIVQYEANVRNPRFGQPVMYRITLNDPREMHSGIGLPMATVRVHWSRVVHITDNLGSSQIFGVPAMRPVLNRLLDIRKVYGADAEGFWRCSFPGLAFSTHPQLGGDVTVDEDSVRDTVENYYNTLQKYLLGKGMDVKTISGNIADPTAHIDCQIEAICIQLGIPKRIFAGSERGQLASSQDDGAWNDRLRERQNNHITPNIIIPFIDRLIAMGVLPQPSGYSVMWPDLDNQTESEKADVAQKKTAAMVQYVQGGADSLVPPKDFLVRFLGMEEEEAESILDDGQMYQEQLIAEQQGAADQQAALQPQVDEFGNPVQPDQAMDAGVAGDSQAEEGPDDWQEQGQEQSAVPEWADEETQSDQAEVADAFGPGGEDGQSPDVQDGFGAGGGGPVGGPPSAPLGGGGGGKGGTTGLGHASTPGTGKRIPAVPKKGSQVQGQEEGDQGLTPAMPDQAGQTLQPGLDYEPAHDEVDIGEGPNFPEGAWEDEGVSAYDGSPGAVGMDTEGQTSEEDDGKKKKPATNAYTAFADFLEQETVNAYCPTGPGGGEDNSCSSSGGGSEGREKEVAKVTKRILGKQVMTQPRAKAGGKHLRNYKPGVRNQDEGATSDLAGGPGEVEEEEVAPVQTSKAKRKPKRPELEA